MCVVFPDVKHERAGRMSILSNSYASINIKRFLKRKYLQYSSVSFESLIISD